MDEIIFCKTRNGLSVIQEENTELVIWRRSLPDSLQNWLDQLEASQLPDTRILVEPDELRPALETLLNGGDLEARDMWARLITDIDDLVSTFADITLSDLVDVRLERVYDDACWKFHRDNVKRRLLTTYRGATTEWVHQAHAEQALLEQKRFEGPLERLEAQDVAIFKGSRVGANRGIVHRSPLIAKTGQVRLLLCLNQQTVASPDPWVKA